jgi:hypothetical protein
MATKSKSEETEPEQFANPGGDDDAPGIPGQIQYPDVHVDAERAAAFAGGKVDNLDPDDEDGEHDGWQNPADRSSEEQTDEDKDSDE